MRKALTVLLCSVLLSSCSGFFQSVGDALHRDGDCWIDTREMILYYKGKEIMTGVTVGKWGPGKSVSIPAEVRSKNLRTVNLLPYKDSLYNRSTEIWVDREDVHWRDHIMFEIDPSDWKKKKIVSRHYYH